MHVFCVIPENGPFIAASHNDKDKHISTISNCQILLPECPHFVFFITLPSFPLNKNSNYLYTENEMLLS